MKQKQVIGALAIASAIALLATGCSAASTTSASAGGALKDTGSCKTITVLTNRTDIAGTVFKQYAKKFEKANPGHAVVFQAITNYQQDVTTRMNTKDYGDVLNIPGGVSPSHFPNLFTPLGTQSDMAKKYYFTDAASYSGKTYAISDFGNANGYVINKTIWNKAGITTPPKTPAEFLSDLAKIKQNTSAIPLYTNYKDGWPLESWSSDFIGQVQGPDAQNNLTTDTAPFSNKTGLGVGNGILFDAVHQKLTEPDPATTDWATSKGLIATGKIATMMLGSWAQIQMEQTATAAGIPASNLAYWPVPVQRDGHFTSVLSGDEQVAINKNSPCQATDLKWINFLINDSGYANSQGGISTVIGGKLPTTLAAFGPLGVKFVQLTPAPKGQENLFASIQKAANVSLSDPAWPQKLVDIARGAAPGTKASYFAQLNSEWANGIKTAGS